MRKLTISLTNASYLQTVRKVREIWRKVQLLMKQVKKERLKRLHPRKYPDAGLTQYRLGTAKVNKRSSKHQVTWVGSKALEKKFENYVNVEVTEVKA